MLTSFPMWLQYCVFLPRMRACLLCFYTNTEYCECFTLRDRWTCFHHGFNFLDCWWDEMDFLCLLAICVSFFSEITKMIFVLYFSRLFTFFFPICRNIVLKIYCLSDRFQIFSPSWLTVFLFSWWVHALNFNIVNINNLLFANFIFYIGFLNQYLLYPGVIKISSHIFF